MKLTIGCSQIKQLENSKPFSNDFTLIKLVHDCLQVQSAKRPSAEVAIQQITMCSNPWGGSSSN